MKEQDQLQKVKQVRALKLKKEEDRLLFKQEKIEHQMVMDERRRAIEE